MKPNKITENLTKCMQFGKLEIYTKWMHQREKALIVLAGKKVALWVAPSDPVNYCVTKSLGYTKWIYKLKK